MVDRAITNLTRKASTADAWLSLVSTQDVVGIKVFSLPGPNSGTRAAVVAAVVEGLLAAGLPKNHVIIWDKQLTDLRLAREQNNLAKVEELTAIRQERFKLMEELAKLPRDMVFFTQITMEAGEDGDYLDANH